MCALGKPFTKVAVKQARDSEAAQLFGDYASGEFKFTVRATLILSAGSSASVRRASIWQTQVPSEMSTVFVFLWLAACGKLTATVAPVY